MSVLDFKLRITFFPGMKFLWNHKTVLSASFKAEKTTPQTKMLVKNKNSYFGGIFGWLFAQNVIFFPQNSYEPF